MALISEIKIARCDYPQAYIRIHSISTSRAGGHPGVQDRHVVEVAIYADRLDYTRGRNWLVVRRIAIPYERGEQWSLASTYDHLQKAYFPDAVSDVVVPVDLPVERLVEQVVKQPKTLWQRLIGT